MKRLLVVVGITFALSMLLAYGVFSARNDRDINTPIVGSEARDFVMSLFPRYQREFGSELRLSEHKGIPMVVNFWASWCAPCYEEAPALQAAWRDYRHEVMFVGVNTQDSNRNDANNFLDQFNITFPNGVDPGSRISIDYGIFGLPETFFVAADGTVRYKHVGPVTPALMREQLDALIEDARAMAAAEPQTVQGY